MTSTIDGYRWSKGQQTALGSTDSTELMDVSAKLRHSTVNYTLVQHDDTSALIL